MLILRRPFENDNSQNNGCGCDINTWDGDCRYVDDGGCGCDD